MTESFDIYHPDVVEAFAAAWASIDGKLDRFTAEKGMDQSHDNYGGYYDGYMVEAQELLRRAANRMPEGMSLWDLLSPPKAEPSRSELIT